MTSTADLIEQTRNELLGPQQEQLNVLSASITATDTSLALTYATDGIQRGMYVSIDLEDMYVVDYTPASKTLTVLRGYHGTTAAAHTLGDVVYIQPRFPSALILKEINADLRALSSPSNGLFRVRTLDLTTVAPHSAYDLEGLGEIIGDPLDVYVSIPGADNRWPDVRQWDFRRNQDPDAFSSGYALRLDESVTPGRPMRVIYRAPFGELSSLSQDVANVSGLMPTAHDIPPLGAAARLIGTSEARRTFLGGQPDSRRATEVPPGSAARAAQILNQMRAKRVAEERSRLQQRYPGRKWA